LCFAFWWAVVCDICFCTVRWFDLSEFISAKCVVPILAILCFCVLWMASEEAPFEIECLHLQKIIWGGSGWGIYFPLACGSRLASLSQNVAAHTYWVVGWDPPTLARRVCESWYQFRFRDFGGYDVWLVFRFGSVCLGLGYIPNGIRDRFYPYMNGHIKRISWQAP
jgi:hypothetical protein